MEYVSDTTFVNQDEMFKRPVFCAAQAEFLKNNQQLLGSRFFCSSVELWVSAGLAGCHSLQQWSTYVEELLAKQLVFPFFEFWDASKFIFSKIPNNSSLSQLAHIADLW